MAGTSMFFKILYSLLALTILVSLVSGGTALKKPGTGTKKSTSSADKNVLREGRQYYGHGHRGYGGYGGYGGGGYGHHHHRNGGYGYGKK